jgi:prepilin-type N-terminal cleavage/methylation domain-containing protein
MHARRDRTGFTLIELLVVIAIIGTLMGLLFPALRAVQRAAWRRRAQEAALQVSKAWVVYLQDVRRFPEDYKDLKRMDGDTLALLNSSGQRIYLEVRAEEMEHGLLDPWGRKALKAGKSDTEIAQWQIRVKLGDAARSETIAPNGDVIRQAVIAWSVGADGKSGTSDDIPSW